MLLILTNKDDLAADYMIVRLEERGIRYFRLNSDAALEFGYHVRLSDTHSSAIVVTGERSLDISDVTAVWYRRAVYPTALSAVAADFRRFAASELRHLVEGLLPSGGDVKWVNGALATERAERKLLQLKLAPRCGLRIPKTIVSSDPRELAQFSNGLPRVICKPISQGLIAVSEDIYSVHTWEAFGYDFADAAAFPTLMQELVPKGSDIRVTIIGSDVYAVEIGTPKNASIDWRASHTEVTYRSVTLPTEVIQACRNLMAELDLAYGAFDFVHAPNDEFYFLEVNPAGEWAWLELQLGFPMRDSFIKAFDLDN